MKELSIEEMTSVRGGFLNIGIVNSSGNAAQANPASLELFSNNAAVLSASGGGAVAQIAAAAAGNQSVTQTVS
jgi:hypothetical protein